MRPSETRWTTGLVLLASFAAFSFGSLVKIASADHYHVNCNNHGLVHGNSTIDGAWHSRVEGDPCHRDSRCDVGAGGNIVYYGVATAGTTCDNLISGFGAECSGNAWTRLTDVFVYHRHNAHSPC